MIQDQEAVENCLPELSEESKAGIEGHLATMTANLRARGFGRKSAEELLGALIRKGFLPLPKLDRYLEKEDV
jgi:hypothetical protein